MKGKLITWLADHAPKWLKQPPFTTLFDAQLWMLTLITNPSLFQNMLDVHHRMRSLKGIQCGTHHFGGISYILGKNELGHMHGDGVFDAHLGKVAAREAIANGFAKVHHAEGGPGWITIDLEKVSANEVLDILQPRTLPVA